MKITFKKSLLPLFLLCLFVSCSSSDDSSTPTKDSTITLSLQGSTTILVGNKAYFAVENNLKENITANSTFTVNGKSVSNPHTFTSAGAYEVIATNGSIISKPVKIQVVLQDSKFRHFTKKVLLEDYTGTWCGYCPGAASAIATASEC